LASIGEDDDYDAMEKLQARKRKPIPRDHAAPAPFVQLPNFSLVENSYPSSDDGMEFEATQSDEDACHDALDLAELGDALADDMPTDDSKDEEGIPEPAARSLVMPKALIPITGKSTGVNRFNKIFWSLLLVHCVTRTRACSRDPECQT
jgi:hypothetical protein